MGVPDIKDYHIAAILDQLKFWFNVSKQKHWHAAEQALVEQGDLTDLLFSTSLAKQMQYNHHPTIVATLQEYFTQKKDIHVRNKNGPIPFFCTLVLNSRLKIITL